MMNEEEQVRLLSGVNIFESLTKGGDKENSSWISSVETRRLTYEQVEVFYTP